MDCALFGQQLRRDFRHASRTRFSPPRVLWAGTGHGCESLETLHDDLETQLDAIGWPPEGRRFSAHLTICRTKSPSAGFSLARSYEAWKNQDFGTTSIDTLAVYHSQLTKQGSIYTPMGRYPMGTAGAR